MRILPLLANMDIINLVMSFLHGGKDHFRLVAEYRTLLLWHDYLNSDWHEFARNATSWDQWRLKLIRRGHNWLQTCSANPTACTLARMPSRFHELCGREADLDEATYIARAQYPVEREARLCCPENCISKVPVFRDYGAVAVSDALQFKLQRAKSRIS